MPSEQQRKERAQKISSKPSQQISVSGPQGLKAHPPSYSPELGPKLHSKTTCLTLALDSSFQCAGGFLDNPFEESSHSVVAGHLPVKVYFSPEAKPCPLTCGHRGPSAALDHSSSGVALLPGCSLLASLDILYLGAGC